MAERSPRTYAFFGTVVESFAPRRRRSPLSVTRYERFHSVESDAAYAGDWSWPRCATPAKRHRPRQTSGGTLYGRGIRGVRSRSTADFEVDGVPFMLRGYSVMRAQPATKVS